jgi:hypothetical protein
MSISSHIDDAKKLTTYTVSDKLTFDEAMAEVENFYKQPTKNVMWDLSNVSELNFSSEEVRKIAGFNQRLESLSRINGKTAIVAPQDLIFGIGKMFQSISDYIDVPFIVMIFRTMEEAQSWLDKEDE